MILRLEPEPDQRDDAEGVEVTAAEHVVGMADNLLLFLKVLSIFRDRLLVALLGRLIVRNDEVADDTAEDHSDEGADKGRLQSLEPEGLVVRGGLRRPELL